MFGKKCEACGLKMSKEERFVKTFNGKTESFDRDICLRCVNRLLKEKELQPYVQENVVGVY